MAAAAHSSCLLATACPSGGCQREIHAPKWKDLPCNNININSKKQKTSFNAIPGTKESHHVDEEDGPSHTSPRKGRSDGQKRRRNGEEKIMFLMVKVLTWRQWKIFGVRGTRPMS
ncbi:hypothetical protein C2845_PM13G11820 [Panicum miliaceum]|uniref:Uncharacterized protein n=1 Tax=Panicum miliaceum TaxID=4540 RepID=A0A3L6RJU8_PANMI|nr:hypothetical protein C2845_PM13G11820 [Panicum miliaceum]